MHDRYLEITFRNGKPLAAYIYLSTKTNVIVDNSKKINTGIVVDFNADGVAVGIEIITPSKVTVNEINNLLNELKIDPISEVEFAPLKAA